MFPKLMCCRKCYIGLFHWLGRLLLISSFFVTTWYRPKGGEEDASEHARPLGVNRCKSRRACEEDCYACREGMQTIPDEGV